MEHMTEGSKKRERRWCYLPKYTFILYALFYFTSNLKDFLVTDIVTLLISLRDPNTQVNEHRQSHGLEDKKANVASDNSVERVPEDLAGRVCYELEPLVLSWQQNDSRNNLCHVISQNFMSNITGLKTGF